VSQAILSRVEKGQRHPTPKTLQKIADALGCTFDEIKPDTDYETDCLMKAIKGMSEPKIKLVTLYARFLKSESK
jgi:transcriptional regulator with XRE-family HTH domain